MGSGSVSGRGSGVTGCGVRSRPPRRAPPGVLGEGHAPRPRAHVPASLPSRASKFTLMLIEIKLAVHFRGSKGCISLLGGEAHLVASRGGPARSVTLSSFVSGLDRLYSALIPPGLRRHNFIGFMVAAALPSGTA